MKLKTTTVLLSLSLCTAIFSVCFFPSLQSLFGKKSEITWVTLNETKPSLSIEARYPQFPTLSASVNTEIEAWILSPIKSFEEDELAQYKEYQASNPEDPYRPGGITIQSKVILMSPHYLSIIAEGDLYAHGAAHPSAWWSCFNYDLKDKKKITLADLFPDEPLYLQKIARLCQQKLKDTVEEKNEYKNTLYELIEKGTKPTDKNFDTFTFTDDEITLYFQQYQVCGYSDKPSVTLKRKEIAQVSDMAIVQEAPAFTVMLPIDATRTPGSRLNLGIEIPDHFKPLQDPRKNFVEFVPKDQDGHNWSEIITTQTFINQGMECTDLIHHLKRTILTRAEETTIIEDTTTKDDSYTYATLIMRYTYRGKCELLFARYYSGPFDCSGVQYTVLINDQTSEQKALQNIKNFIKNNTFVIPF